MASLPMPRTFLFLGLCWLPLTVWADEVQVNGRAVDENGAAVASAQVRFSIEGTLPRGDFQATTGPTGGFSLRLPFPGRWRVTVRCQGFFPLEKQGIEIRASPQDLQLILHRWREMYQSVQVNTEPAAVDLNWTDEQKTLNRSNLLNIPFSGRDLRGAMKLMPGVVQDSKEGLHFSGSLPNQVAYTLDGFNISDPLTGRFTTRLNVDSVRSLEYSTGRFSPEFGKGSAGTVAISTNIGGDQIRYTATNFVPGIDTKSGVHIGTLGAALLPFRPLGETACMVLRERRHRVQPAFGRGYQERAEPDSQPALE